MSQDDLLDIDGDHEVKHSSKRDKKEKKREKKREKKDKKGKGKSKRKHKLVGEDDDDERDTFKRLSETNPENS